MHLQEIFSYIVDGELSHADSMGNKESLGRGAVQYLSAGTGITHSEMNDGAERCRCVKNSQCAAYAHNANAVRFLQIWIMPEKRGETPQYGSKKVWLVVASKKSALSTFSIPPNLAATLCFKFFVEHGLHLKQLECHFLLKPLHSSRFLRD